MRRIAEKIGREWQLVPYKGADFNGIFAGLDDGTYDCRRLRRHHHAGPAGHRRLLRALLRVRPVAGRRRARHPNVRGIDDLKGLVIGVQKGNTSQPVADKLVAEGRAARVRVYAYDEIETALGDLSTGGCDAFMKLAPVTHWFVRDRPKLVVVQTGITREILGVCVRKGDTALRDAINAAQAALAKDGTLGALIKQWLGEGAIAPP